MTLVKYFWIMSPFSILIFLSLSLSANFLWSLLPWNIYIKAFHIAYGFSLPWRLKTMWSLTPSNNMLLAFASFFYHAPRSWESDVVGLGISFQWTPSTRYPPILPPSFPSMQYSLNFPWVHIRVSSHLKTSWSASRSWRINLQIWTCSRQTRFLLFYCDS